MRAMIQRQNTINPISTAVDRFDAMIGNITSQAEPAIGTVDACKISDPVRLELTALFGITENAEGETE